MIDTRKICKSALLRLDNLVDDIRYKRDHIVDGEFPYSGTIAVCGYQGSGKSLSCHLLIAKILEMYPDCILISNTTVNYAPYIKYEGLETLEKHKNIIDGVHKGVILYIDEMSTQFGNMSNDGKVSPEWLFILSMLRKRHLLCFCSTPIYSRINKAWRESFDTIIITDVSFFGHLQTNYIFKNNIDTMFCKEEDKLGNMVLEKVWRFWRSSKDYQRYDTFEIIKRIGN